MSDVILEDAIGSVDVPDVIFEDAVEGVTARNILIM